MLPIRRSTRRLRAMLAAFDLHPLTRGHRTRAMGRYLGFHLRGRLSRRARVFPFVGDVRFLARPGLAGIVGNIFFGLDDYEDMGFLLHVLRPADLFVDVGANVGGYTLLAAGAAGARGIAFEPVPETFRLLLENLDLNGLRGRVEARNAGVGAREETLRFTGGRGAMNRVATGPETVGELSVVSATLDDQLERAPLLLKIDVEGFEGAVLAGAARVLADGDLRAILMELNGSGRRYGVEDSELHERLLEAGFAPFRYDPAARALKALDTWRTDQFNTLYLRDVDFVRERVAGARTFQVLGQRI